MTITQDQFGAEYTRSKDAVVHFCQSLGATEDEAVEAAQTAWCRGWEVRGTFKGNSSIATWIGSIAHNILRSLWRTHRYSRTLPLGEVLKGNPIRQLSYNPTRRIEDKLHTDRLLLLARRDRAELLRLMAENGWDLQETARIYNTSRSSILMRRSKAKAEIRAALRVRVH